MGKWSMRVLRFVVVTDAIAVAACAVGYLLLAQAVDSQFGEAARPNTIRSESLRDRTTGRHLARPGAAVRSPADRIRDVFEQFPGSQQPAIKSRNRRGDGILFS